MRPWVTVAYMALFLGVIFPGMIVFSPSFSSAQEPPESKRKIVSKAAPVYPELARKLQISGAVRMEVVVAASGRARWMQVVGGNPLLAQSAVEAIGRWRWESAAQETKEFIVLDFRP